MALTIPGAQQLVGAPFSIQALAVPRLAPARFTNSASEVIR